jgi:alpha-L-arabinofuranosidase
MIDTCSERSLSIVSVCLAAAVIGASGSGSVDAQATIPASITIDASSVQGPISPLLHGQFLEFMFEGIKSGLTTEMIRDRGFEAVPSVIGLPRDWNRYPDDRNDDYGLPFHWDGEVAYAVATDHFQAAPTQYALRVDASAGVVERRGIYQSRLLIRSGVIYRRYLWLKPTGYAGPVTIALEEDTSGGDVYAEAEIHEVSGDWRQYSFTLRPGRADPLAQFAVLFPGTGRLWVDQVSLEPGDATNGVRADVLDRIEALRPSFFRWPGGNVAQDCHWIWRVGPRDRRPTWSNMSWKNEPEPGDFGTDEYIALSRRIGA